MLGAFECDERLIEAISLPVGLGRAPIAVVTCEAKQNFVTSEILRSLIMVAATCSRSAY